MSHLPTLIVGKTEAVFCTYFYPSHSAVRNLLPRQFQNFNRTKYRLIPKICQSNSFTSKIFIPEMFSNF